MHMKNSGPVSLAEHDMIKKAEFVWAVRRLCTNRKQEEQIDRGILS